MHRTDCCRFFIRLSLVVLCLCLNHQAWAASLQGSVLPEPAEKAFDSSLSTPNNVATDKQWVINLIEYTNYLKAEDLVRKLEYKNFDATVIQTGTGQFQVRIVDLFHYSEAVEYRKRLLEKTNIFPSHVYIVVLPDQQGEMLEQPLLEQPAPKEAVSSGAHQPEENVPQRQVGIAPDKVAAPLEPEQLITHVLLNTVDAGNFFVTQMPNHDILVARTTLKEIGLIAPFPGDDGQSELLSLRAMAPTLEFKLDSMAGTLTLQADPSLLPVNSKDLQLRSESTATLIQDSAMFVNYNLSYLKSRGSKSVVSAPLEISLNMHGVSLINNVNWQQGKVPLRTQSQLVYDDKDSLRRWMAGDIQGSAGVIGSASLGGIRLFKNYGLRPSFFTGPPLALSATLLTPSEVEVRIDGQSVYQGFFPAGQLNLANIPYYQSGLGRAEILVRDAFGRETVFDQSFYASSSLLGSGLQTYDYAIGVEQSRNVNGMLRYANKPILIGTHRYGLNDWLTSGFGIESDGSDIRAGFMADMILGAFGQLGVVAAGSHRQGFKGANLQLNYSYTGGGVLSTSLFFSTQSAHFGGILGTLTQPDTATRWRTGGTLSAGLGRAGSLTTRLSRLQSFAGVQTQDAAMIFSTVLPGQVAFTTQFTRKWKQLAAASNQINASLGYSFENGLYVSANFDRSNRSNTFTLQVQMSPPLGDGVGYSTSVNSPGQGEVSSNTRLQYNHRYGEMALSRSGTNKLPTHRASLNGALLLAGGGLHLSRPIRDGFALVKVTGLNHVPVNIQNQRIGETNAAGVLAVPNMLAYSDNKVSIDPSVIPLGYKIEATSKTVTSSYRGGGVVEFNVLKMQTVEGEVYYRKAGKLISAQYSVLEFDDGDGKNTSIVGYGNVLYLENVNAGTYQARLFNTSMDCQFKLHISQSDDMINNIGKVICDVDK